MKKYKKIILFLFKFLGSYGIMVLLYVAFLNATQESENQFVCDPITQKVAEQTVDLLLFFNFKSYTDQNTAELSFRLFVEDKFVARVVEGCNSISVIILFIAFIISFSGNFKVTTAYILAGSLVIYIINVFRIAFIAVVMYQFPEYSDFLHQIIFPLIIYGTTFLLWVIWINYFLPKYQK
ncbi:MAG: exosortase family protein XrtF [Flavobacteriaceae bacterium]|nr:exosortase family protein XrtF [Flavobacteriaceae bacterium]